VIGLTLDKILVIALIAGFLIGPERLPALASALARFVRKARGLATNARDHMKEEMGDDFDAIDWQQLDPRKYDPRRIIREALLDDQEQNSGKG
jgi:sec-independent protein translocase protein TatB